MTYTIIKVMNNNVILVTDQATNVECMLIGKGLGFSKKSGDVVTAHDGAVDKVYYASDDKHRHGYQEIVNHIDRAIIGTCEEFIHEAEGVLGKLSAQVHIVLIDHIAFAIERVKNDMVIDNPFLFEIKTLYPKEFELGLRAVERINQEFELYLPSDEAGFIALHLYAASQKTQVKDAMKQTRIITEVMQFIEGLLDRDLKNNELAYIRLLSHMRGAIDRHNKGIISKNPLLPTIKTEMKTAYKLAKRVGQFLKQEYNLDFGEQEVGYLAIHIERIREITS